MHEALAANEAPATWEGMDTSYAEWPAGTDLTRLFKGLPDDKCPCPHWGYVIKGSVHFGYADGTKETVKAGGAFYTPSGHTVWTDEDVALVLFSPTEEHKEILAHVERVLAEDSK
jgi:hypothetical protein